MKIKTQLIITILLFSMILVTIAVSTIIVNQLTKKASEQEKIASSIAEGANELSYLANDYLVYRESQQLKRWQSRFASFSNQVTSLSLHKPEQQAAIRNIQANQQRLKEVFDSVASNVGRPSQNRRAALDPPFFQVSWSRMAVQSQGLISDASRLSQLLHRQTDRLRETRTMLIYVMVGLLALFLLAGYMLTYRRILKSIVTLQAGAAAIGSGNLDFTIEEKKRDEIGDLAHAFNKMTTDLKAVTASKADLEREIVDRKRAEEDLRQQREWLRVTLSSIGDAVMTTDTEGRITFLNPVAETLTGWQLEETLGQPIQTVFRIINEKTREPAEDLVARVLGEKRVVALANDTALVTKDGHELLIEDSAAPIKDTAGNVIGVVLVFHDVTERRRAQAALREAHERAAWLARFPEQNPNPVLRASAEGSALYCNSASVGAHGWACEVGQPLPHPLLLLVGQAMTERQEVERDVELGERFYSVLVTPFPGEGYANVYGRDITERKRAEKELRESQARLEAVFAAIPDVILEYDASGRPFKANEAALKAIGLSSLTFTRDQAVANLRFRNLDGSAVRIEDLPTSRALRGEMVAGDLHSIRTADGIERIVSTYAAPLYEGGRVSGVVALWHDITELKRVEEALRESEERYRNLFNTMDEGFCIIEIIFDAEGRPTDYRFLEVNAAFEKRTGLYDGKDKLMRDLAPGQETHWFETYGKIALTGEPLRFVNEARALNRWYDVNAYRVGKPEDRQVAIIFNDISGFKRAEAALRQQTIELQHLTETLEQQVRERTEKLEEANKALRQLSIRLLSAHEEERKKVAGELHDTIGSCLSGIKFKVESALEEITKTPKAATESLSTIVPVIRDAIEECRRIQMDLRPSMLDDLGLLPTLSWFFRRFQTIYSMIHIEQKMTIEESELPDSLKTVMYRIIQEAMNNVAKHSKADLIRISLRKVHNKMELSVKDNGCGFSVQQRPFLDNSRRGLGLTSMRERTELSGGSFAVESAEGKGTMIRASWPL